MCIIHLLTAYNIQNHVFTQVTFCTLDGCLRIKIQYASELWKFQF